VTWCEAQAYVPVMYMLTVGHKLCSKLNMAIAKH